MTTPDGKCDGKCATCNMMQQVYCALNRLMTEQDGKMNTRLERIEEAVSEIGKRLNSELRTAQGGGGATTERPPEV